MNNYLSELFALPIGLKQVQVIDSISLYGSQTLNDKFIQAMSETKRGKYILQTVKEMVNNKTIVPCFADPGIISHFRRRISKDSSGGLMRILRAIVIATEPINHPLDHVLAFYYFESNTITVLISNHISENKVFTSTAANSALALSLTHEMVHMFAHTQPNKFISLFKDELNSYYSIYLTKIFKLNKDKSKEKLVEQFYKHLFFELEMKNVSRLNELINILLKFQKYSKLKEDEFKNVVAKFFKLTRLLLTNNVSDIIPTLRTEYKDMILPLYTTYKDIFGKVPSKGCTQELYFPSEVICGYSDIRFDSKIQTALNHIV